MDTKDQNVEWQSMNSYITPVNYAWLRWYETPYSTPKSHQFNWHLSGQLESFTPEFITLDFTQLLCAQSVRFCVCVFFLSARNQTNHILFSEIVQNQLIIHAKRQRNAYNTLAAYRNFVRWSLIDYTEEGRGEWGKGKGGNEIRFLRSGTSDSPSG